MIYLLIFIWMAMSFFMNLMNKQCTILLHCPFTLVMLQMCVTIVVFLSCTPVSDMENFNKENLMQWSLLAVLFSLMLISSMFAFLHASVTYLLVMRNCLPLFTLPLERAVQGASSVPISPLMVVTLSTIAIGSGMYAHFSPGSSEADTYGLGWIFLNCIVTVVHCVLERYVLTTDMKLSNEAMTLINNVIPLPLVGMLAWATGEVQQWPHYRPLLASPVALAILTCSGLVGLILGQSSIMVQRCLMATSMMVLQTMTKLFIILAAMIVFHDRFTVASCLGCCISLLACGAYGLAQRSATQQASPEAPRNDIRGAFAFWLARGHQAEQAK
jgi:hypothetical protein